MEILQKEEYKTMGRKFSSGDFELKIILVIKMNILM